MTKAPYSKHRRAARLAAIQALYQLDLSGETSKVVIKEFQNHRFDSVEVEVETPVLEEDGLDVGETVTNIFKEIKNVDNDFFEDIVEGVIRFQQDIDTEIAAHLSQKWTMKRLDMTLRAIMRSAAYEILRRPDVPALVIIDQYVSISADFFDGKEPGFVNGALDRLAKKVRAAEFGLTGPATSPEHG